MKLALTDKVLLPLSLAAKAANELNVTLAVVVFNMETLGPATTDNS